jgi:phage-related protein
MKKKTDKNFLLRIAASFLIIIIVPAIFNNDRLNALTEAERVNTGEKTPVKIEKDFPDKKGDTPAVITETTPAATEKSKTGLEDENSTTTDNGTPSINSADDKADKPPIEKEQLYIKAEELFKHPEIILNAYKEAYPGLITDITMGENDWIIKFANGNIYYWADGKILPESVLPESDKFISYSIYPYNMNGRCPELYTEEQINKLRVKKKPDKKKKFVPGEEGSLYKELFAITTKKSAIKHLSEVKLSGHYIKVHRSIAEKIISIDSKINTLAKTDPEVRSFVKTIGSVQAFNWRKIAGTNRRSNHSYGIAIDILPKKYRKKIIYWSWEQDKNKDWMLLPQSCLWTPPEQVVKIFFGGLWWTCP